eukprot:CAMPEP_0181105772 /NCGR_PEP_ID=MMETSP1071-20121207/16169_1 /TAXON_ID=35127 /ORGANISM="Thalassiosira sp., Strain NH16" /LENGTH=262 /DNA_ID=CAMNT_0023189119 /DNA_START=61 /DNA_END=849 /DNA_ORIENTATION=-
MTIVATAETRNAAWANDQSSFGRKMLSKMGWKGDGLGKNQQGSSTHLRAVRRADSLGIGAENDAFGDKGWADTNRGFHGVLANLKQEYGSGSGSDDEAVRKKRKKEAKKRKKKEDKRRQKSIAVGGDGSGSSGANGVRLPQNKVQAGHARKMREAKDIRNKSAADMAAIFGVKADFYKQPREWVEGASSKSAGQRDSADSSLSGAVEKKKKKSKKKSRELKECKSEIDNDGKRDKKKRRRPSEADTDSSDDRKKRKKDKSEK